MSAPRIDGPLTLVLTRRCDLRCGYCPQSFRDADMSAATLDAALEELLPRLAPGRPVRLFGGEPLLVPELVRRAVDAACERSGAPVELPTNGTRLDAKLAGFLAARPRVRVELSRFNPLAAGLPNLSGVIVLRPGDPPETALAALARWAAAGARRVNVLPAYYVPWAPAQLEGLRRALRAVGEMLERLASRGRPVALVNRERRGSAPLFGGGGGLAVDVDGARHASTLFLMGGRRFSRETLAATAAVDALLAELVHAR